MLRRLRRHHARTLILEVDEAQPGVDEPTLLAALMALGSHLDPQAHAVLTIVQAPGTVTVKGATPDGDAIPLLAAVLHRMLQDQLEARKAVRRRLAAAGQRDWVGG